MANTNLPGYIHRGVVAPNCVVDTSESTHDPARLAVSPSDDALHVVTDRIGNFEWWYFDLIDAASGLIVKLVVHLGTDPLRRRIFPQVAVSVAAPGEKASFQRPYSADQLKASRDRCDVRLHDAFHAFTEASGGGQVYRLIVKLPRFRSELTFVPELPGWKPLGDEVMVQRGKKKASFSWVVAVPRARVTGDIVLGGQRYELVDALGYHDHNYWSVAPRGQLAMDHVISGWYWGRFLGRCHTVVFMDTRLREGSVRSLMIGRGGRIIHSSNNLAEVRAKAFRRDLEVGAEYPSKIEVCTSTTEPVLDLDLEADDVVETTDLLEGVPPLLRSLIRRFVAKPAYYGICARATSRIDDESESGVALYESMTFRDR